MFSKSTCLALFTLAASTFSAQAVPLKQSFETETFCNTATIAISTVVHTQTVEVTKYITAANSQSTGSSSGKSSSGSSSSSSSNSSGSSSNSSGSSSKSSGSSSNSSGSSSKSSGSKGSSGDKGKGSKSSTTTTAAATTTSTAVNIDNSGGSSSSSGSGSDSGSDSDSGASAAAIALQTSLVLDPSVVCSGFANDGQSPPIAGQTASATTTNNFINFCALTLPGTPITNGQQITSGSCNPAPIGLIPSTSNMPSAKFTFPTNFATIASDTPFTITMALKNMQAGTFTDATKNYFAAPQTLNAQGQIIGHSHFVVESLTSIDQTTPNDPVKFVFFKGIDDAGVNGILSTPVAAGLPAGTYRVCSINSSSNHQPVIVPVAQHGALDDCSYFTAAPGGAATATGAAAGNSTLAATGSANSTASAKGSANATAIATGSNSTVSASASAVGSASVASASAVATGKAAKGKGGSKSVSAVAASASAAPAVASAAAAVPAAASAAVAAPAVASAAVAKPAAASAAVAAPAVASASAAAAVPAVASASAAAPPAASASAVGAAAAAAAVPDKSSSKSSSKGGKN